MKRTRQLVSLGARLSSVAFHSRAVVVGAASLQQESATASEGILFPREGPGVNYALNWALARSGVTPSGEALRNLPLEELKNKGASSPGSKTGVDVFVKGTGPLTKPKFSRLFKEVTTQLSNSPTVYVHDGAVGSASKIDARTRVISDTPGGALSLASLLSPTPTRDLSADSFPLNVYVVSSLSSSVLENSNFVAFDPDSSAIIIAGSAIGDKGAIKSVLAAASAPIIFEFGGLPLPGRLLVEKETSVLLLSPESVKSSLSSLSPSSVSPDVGVVLSEKGVSRLFQIEGKGKTEPNLYPLPSSIALVTSDSSGAIPPISQLTPSQAAYYFLAGFDGKGFKPAYNSGLPSSSPSLSPLFQAKKLAEMLTESKISAYLINASAGEKLIPAKDLEKLLISASTQRLPKGGPKPGEKEVNALRAKFDEFIKKTFPDLPETIAP